MTNPLKPNTPQEDLTIDQQIAIAQSYGLEAISQAVDRRNPSQAYRYAREAATWAFYVISARIID